MKVLITGAFGNLGLMCVEQALAMGYKVVCFDLDNEANRKKAEVYMGRVITILGDLCDTTMQQRIVEDVDAIIHNASVLPPVTDNNPALAEKINVEACRQLIDAAAQSEKKPVFIFPSSVTVFGQPESFDSFKRADDAVNPTDNYTRHKVAIEEYLNSVELPWVVLRVGVSVDARTLATDRGTFKKLLNVHPRNPLEYVHPKDVALAMCEAVRQQEAQGKVLLIGGGKNCQVSQREFITTAFDALGLDMPMSVHGQDSFYTHWMDTEESQRILQFQKHDFSGYIREMQNKLRLLRIILWPLRWLINPLLPVLLRKL